MRKITADALRAFRNWKKFKRGNTEVKVNLTECYLYLHGNMIAKFNRNDGLWISDGGWQTNTTKERLNGLPNVHIYQKDFQWYLNDEAWNGEWTYICF